MEMYKMPTNCEIKIAKDGLLAGIRTHKKKFLQEELQWNEHTQKESW